MAIIKCKMCGGDVELAADKTFGTCEYCGSTMTFPKVDDEQRAAAFNRGNHFRRIGEFDKALAVYERIVREDDTDAEAHWCCALCRFGIEYVEDPATYEYLPTCHRASFDSFLEDVDYLAAVEHSEGLTKRQYQKDAAKIAEVQRGILATSQNEEPFDVFICYKESDENGQRTRDSLMAQDVYYQLTDQGYRVFFSRITLEDMAGKQYEPYIFAALNSAKVMIVIGTKAEYMNAVWVKNEWSRFLAMMKKDHSKLLLPCYRDMDPYDMPEQLSVLQSYDMSKIGFIQDLIRGIKKVLEAEKLEPTTEKLQPPTTSQEVAPLLRRIELFLEDGEWDRADTFCEQVLNIDPENAAAYIGKLQIEYRCGSKDALRHLKEPISGSKNYNKILRFGSSEEIAFLRQVNQNIEENLEKKKEEKRQKAKALFASTGTVEFLDVTCPHCKQIASYPPAVLLNEAVPCPMCGRTVDYTKHIENIADVSSLDDLIAMSSSYGVPNEIKLGDCIQFGRYLHSEEMEDIEWRVLAVNDGKVLVISKYALDCAPYSTNHTSVTWENSTLRRWLNQDFIYAAFSEEEIAMIPTVMVTADNNPDFDTNPGNPTQDKIFLLSVADMDKYFPSPAARTCEATDHAIAKGAWEGDNGNCFWWLRTPGDVPDSAAGVDENGEIDTEGDYIHCDDYAVRPALWIDLS